MFFSLKDSAATSPAWTGYQGLLRTQWLAPTDIDNEQLRRFRELLAHSIRHVPYYRERLAGIDPAAVQSMADLRCIPLLQRETYQRRHAEFAAAALPEGTAAAGECSTSGTSGIPIEVRHTNVSQTWWQACYLRDLEWAGLDPTGRLAALRTVSGLNDEQRKQFREGISVPFWHRSLNDLIQSGDSYGMDLHQEPTRQLDWLRRVQPDYLLSYPSNLEYLATLLHEQAKPIPNLKVIQTFAETLTDDVRARIEVGFGVPVKNLYSSCEAGYIGSTCPAGHGLHVHAENVLVEVLNNAEEPCSVGERGSVVLTTLHNYLTPFIRYEIMDEATVGPACSCGRGLPLLTHVWGKQRPMFHLPGGGRKSPVELVENLRKLGGLRQHQIIQRQVEHVLLRLVPAQDWSDARLDNVKHLFNDFFGAPIHVEIEMLERLPLPASGKLIDVICEVATH